MASTFLAEDPICPKCGHDDIECLEDCTLHKCIDCGYSEETPHIYAGDAK